MDGVKLTWTSLDSALAPLMTSSALELKAALDAEKQRLQETARGWGHGDNRKSPKRAFRSGAKKRFYVYASTCKICGLRWSKEYTNTMPRNRLPQYCSWACRRKGLYSDREKHCLTCGKTFHGKGRCQIYCSLSCYREVGPILSPQIIRYPEPKTFRVMPNYAKGPKKRTMDGKFTRPHRSTGWMG